MLKQVKYLGMGLVLGLAASAVASSNLNTNLAFSPEDEVVVYDQYGHEVPFPKIALMPFPWHSIEGFWVATVGEIEGLFSFSVDRTDSFNKTLNVIYWNKYRTAILGQGRGHLEEDQKVIRAVMTGPNFNYVFKLGAYNVHPTGTPKAELVTSLLPIHAEVQPRRHSHFIIRKLN